MQIDMNTAIAAVAANFLFIGGGLAHVIRAIGNVHRELKPNGGTTIADKVERIELKQNSDSRKIDEHLKLQDMTYAENESKKLEMLTTLQTDVTTIKSEQERIKKTVDAHDAVIKAITGNRPPNIQT